MQNRKPLRLVALAAAALALTTWAVPAEARGGRHERHEKRHWAHHVDRQYRDHGFRQRRAAPVYRHETRRASRYYCAPCQHGFDSRRGFRSHLRRSHHIPPWRIPFVVVHGLVHGVFAWVFHG